MKKILFIVLCFCLICGCDNQNDAYKNLTSSQENADMIIDNIKKYNENINASHQSYNQEKRDNGYTYDFYEYYFENDVIITISFNNTRNILNNINILAHDTSYTYGQLKINLLKSLNLYDKCIANENCNSAIEDNNDVEIVIDDYEIDNTEFINSFSVRPK